MLRSLVCSTAILAIVAAGVLAAEDKDKKNKEGGKATRATITKVDPQHHTVTVKMKDRRGKEVEKTFQLTEELRMLDETGKVVAIDVFQAGNDVLVVEREGKLVALRKNQKKARDEPATARGGAPLGFDVDRLIQEYDRNKDGFLDRDEVPARLREHFDQLDTNKDGKLSREELQQGAVYWQPHRRPSDLVYVLIEMSDCEDDCQGELQYVYDVLRKLDKNGDGKIDPEELKAMRQQLIAQRADTIIKEVDTNKDGKISREEARGRLKKDFDRLDVNKDGFIDRAELIRAISENPLGKSAAPRSTDKSQQRPDGQ